MRPARTVQDQPRPPLPAPYRRQRFLRSHPMHIRTYSLCRVGLFHSRVPLARKHLFATAERAPGQVRRLGAQSPGSSFVRGNSVRDDTSAPAIDTAQPLHKTGDGRSSLYAEALKVFIAQNALVATVQASHLYNELDRFHDQSSSISRLDRGRLRVLEAASTATSFEPIYCELREAHS